MSEGIAGSIGATPTPKLSRLVAAKVYEQTSGVRAGGRGRLEAAPPGLNRGQLKATPPGINLGRPDSAPPGVHGGSLEAAARGVDGGDRFESSMGLDVSAGPGAANAAGGPAALPFYTNPALRVEAAVGIALGRELDVKG